MIIGAILLVFGFLFMLAARQEHHRLGTMARTETVSCADLAALRTAAATAAGGADVFRHVCEVVGTARPGETGPLIAELSGAECVWYRNEVRRRYEVYNADDHGHARNLTRTETVKEMTSSQPFLVVDGSGTAVVDPAGAPLDHAEQVVSRFESNPDTGGVQVAIGGVQVAIGGVHVSGSHTLGYEYDEWVLRPGQQVYVLGEAVDRDGQLTVRKPEDGHFVMSAKSKAETSRSLRVRQLWTGLVAAALAAGGAAFMVHGLLS